jgi:hypothetical protein
LPYLLCLHANVRLKGLFSQVIVYPNGTVYNSPTYPVTFISEVISEFPKVNGVTPVSHRKLLQAYSGRTNHFTTVGQSGYTDTYYYNAITKDVDKILLPADFDEQIRRQIANRMGASELKTSFELLPFLADLDGTFAMFSLKFLRELSYGSITWGLLPFISDVRNLCTSLKSLFGQAKRRLAVPVNRVALYSYSRDLLSLPNGNLPCEVIHVHGAARVKGVTSFQMPNYEETLGKVLFLLDTLGVHPDLKTLWDIVPLSFVVDYFLPIGAMLESLHPRGWGTQSVSFEGTVSRKEYWHFFDSSIDQRIPSSGQMSTFVNGIMSVYSREYYSGVVSSPVVIDWESPTLLQIFNTAYLSGLLRRF